MEKKLLTISEVSEATSIGRSALYKFIASGKLPVVKIGRSTRFRPEDVREFVRKAAEGRS